MILDEDTGLYYENNALNSAKKKKIMKENFVTTVLKMVAYVCILTLLYLILGLFYLLIF